MSEERLPEAGDPRGAPTSAPPPERLTPLAREALALLALLALVALVFRGVVVGGELLYDRDVHLYWLAQVQAIRAALAAGSLPLWDPDAGFGAPLLEAPTGFFYPPTWLAFLAPAPWYAYGLLAILHTAFGGYGLYRFARRMGASPAAGLGGAALWMGSGPLLSTVSMMNLLVGGAWMPWTLLAADRAVERPSAWRAALWGACVAVPVLSGSETVLMIGPLSAAWALVRIARETGPGHRRRALAASVAAALFAVGLAAPQWLPFVAASSRNARGALPRAVRTHWSVAPADLAQLALPLHPGEQLASGDDAAPERRALPYLYSIHLGLPALALALAGLASPRRDAVRLLAATAALAAAVALGRYTPVYDAVAALPLLKSLRFPMKAMLLVGLCVALLAALGIDACRERRRLAPLLGLAASAAGVGGAAVAAVSLPAARARFGLAVLVALVAAAAFAAARGRPALARTAPVALAAAGAAHLVASHAWINPTAPVALYRYSPETLEAVRADGGDRVVFREGTPDPGARGAAAAPALPGSLGLAVGMRLYLYPPAARLYGLSSGYDADVTGMQPEATRQLAEQLPRLDADGQRRLLRLGAVSHVVSLGRPLDPEGAPRLVATSPTGDPVTLERVSDALPRSYAVGGWRVAPGASAMAALLAPDFAPDREVILDSGEPRPAPEGFAGRSRVVARDGGSVALEAELSHDGYVVLVEAFEPTWRAERDGEPVEIERANGGFRAVAVPAGRHRIAMRYRPPAVRLGMTVGALALLAAAAAWAAGRRARASASPGPG